MSACGLKNWAILLFGAALLFAAELVGNQVAAAEGALKRVFKKHGVVGAIVIKELGTTKFHIQNAQRIAVPLLPASTFKIPHTLIALETGAISSLDEVFKWDGTRRFVASWNRDLSVRQAFRVSAVPVYQRIAERVGVHRMRSWLAKLDYGNGAIGDTVTSFWLQGPLAISANDQLRFLERLATRSLPARRANQDAVVEAMRLNKGEVYSLFGKTGWALREGDDLGWFVGWLSVGEKAWLFALNMDIEDRSKARLRKIIAGEALSVVTGLDVDLR